MKESIYTIPIMDGFNEWGECPFCNMYAKLEEKTIENILNTSSLEDKVRLEINKLGFCKEHYKKIYLNENHLGFTPILQSHMKFIDNEINNIFKKTVGKKSFFSKNRNEVNYDKVCDYLKNLENSCYLCKKVNLTFSRYIDTFFYLWQNNHEVIPMTENCSGFCRNHFSMLLKAGKRKLHTTDYQKFAEIIITVEKKNLNRLEEELINCIKNNDVQNQSEAKESLKKAIKKVSSLTTLD